MALSMRSVAESIGESEVVESSSPLRFRSVRKIVTFSSLKPQLLVEAPKASEAIKFYKDVFFAIERSRITYPKRKTGQDVPHIVYCHSSSPALPSSSVTPSIRLLRDQNGPLFRLETDFVDAAVAKAVEAGAVAEGEIFEGYGGGRMFKVRDPYGFAWLIGYPSSGPGPFGACM